MKQKTGKCKIKRGLAVTTAVLCMISSLGMFGASANNCKDTDGKYSVGGYAWKWTNPARKKTDYTSSYQKCISSNVTYYSWVYGSKIPNPQNISQLTAHPTNPKTGKITPSYTFKTGTTRYMINYVKENRLPYAGMMFWTGSTKTGKTHIKWSPDSV